jgi:hypothetical protein
MQISVALPLIRSSCSFDNLSSFEMQLPQSPYIQCYPEANTGIFANLLLVVACVCAGIRLGIRQRYSIQSYPSFDCPLPAPLLVLKLIASVTSSSSLAIVLVIDVVCCNYSGGANVPCFHSVSHPSWYLSLVPVELCRKIYKLVFINKVGIIGEIIGDVRYMSGNGCWSLCEVAEKAIQSVE